MPGRRTTFGRSILPSFISERPVLDETGSIPTGSPTHRRTRRDSLTEVAWVPSYWAGEPYPNATPIWETLVEGRMIVLGTSLREQAYAAMKRHFPNSLMFLEIARQAAWVGSDLGNICAWLGQDGDELALKYLMDMQDAQNPDILGRLVRLQKNGHPINWADMAPHIAQDSFGRVPDLRPFGFRRHHVEMTYVDGRN